jgi:hypothetical protein
MLCSITRTCVWGVCIDSNGTIEVRLYKCVPGRSGIFLSRTESVGKEKLTNGIIGTISRFEDMCTVSHVI